MRRLAKEGVVDRTVGDDRGRYSFTGKNDPQVKAVVAAVKAGVKKTPAAKKTTKKPASKPVAKKTTAASKRKAKKVEEVDD